MNSRQHWLDKSERDSTGSASDLLENNEHCLNPALCKNSSDKESNRQSERLTWSQSLRNKDDKESSPGAPEGGQRQRIEVLTVEETIRPW